MDTPILPQSNKNPVGGIYQWTQISTGKKYIGSSKDIERRRMRHVQKLTRRRHDNLHFNNAWTKCGEHDFAFTILEIVEDESQLVTREQWYFDNIVRWDFDFNHCKIAGCPPSAKGRVVSEATRKALRDSNVGQKRTSEQNRNNSLSRLGKKTQPHTETSRQKTSKSLLGHPVSEETRKKLSEKNRGRVQTEEEKQKRRKPQKRKNLSPKPHSEESRQRQAESLRRTMACKRERKQNENPARSA